MTMLNLNKQKYSLFSLLIIWLCLSIHTSLFAQGDITEDDIRKMKDGTEKFMKTYFFNLTQIGRRDPGYEKYIYDDIGTLISSSFENSTVKVYNDIVRVKDQATENLGIREYLEKSVPLYPNGISFEYQWTIKAPCSVRKNDENYFSVRVTAKKKLEGMYQPDNAVNINSDSLDIFVKFPVKQNRPVLVLDLPRIYGIFLYNASKSDCEEEIEENVISITPFEEELLRARAELFINDFGLTLNIIGNPTLNERFETTDYFEYKNTSVYNDIFPEILKDEFIAEDYLRYVELWYQEGIVFEYNEVKATNVLTRKDHVSVEVEVDRTIKVPSRNYRDRQRVSFFVKFPVDPKAKTSALHPNNSTPSVGLERMTPRIYKTEKKRAKVNQKNYLSIGLQLNAANYFGDLNPFDRFLSTEWKFTRPSVSIQITRKMSQHIFLRGSLSFASIKGDDYTSANPNDNIAKYRYIRNAHFRNQITELALIGVYEIKANKGLYYKRRFFSPYVFAGIAFFYHNPQARTPLDPEKGFTGSWVDLRSLHTEGQGKAGYPKVYSKIQPAIPFGFGAKFKITNRIDLGWEFGIRLTFTDYLDDVSGNYADPGDLNSDLARVMANRTLEPYAQAQGANRTDLPRLINENNGGPLNFLGKDGQTYTTFNGYGRQGDQRGNPSSKDFYILTGFRLNYLLRVGQPPSSKQKPLFKIDLD